MSNTNCKIISKCFSRWHQPLIEYFKNIFDNVEIIYFNKVILESKKPLVGRNLVEYFTQKIDPTTCSCCVFDMEFSWLLSPKEIQLLSDKLGVPTYGISMDDDRFHSLNRVLYSGVDSVLTFPLAVERYKLIGKEAFPFFPSFELAFQEPTDTTSIKDIPVLFYGLLKGERKQAIETLKKKGINIYIPDFSTENDKLIQLIKRSKIVLNFSSGSPMSNNPLQFLPFNKQRDETFPVKQLKSRIFEVGSLGSLCITDEFAGADFVFSKGELIICKSIEQMAEEIKKLTDDNEYYEQKLASFLEPFNDRFSLKTKSAQFFEYHNEISKEKSSTKNASRLLYQNTSLIEACSLSTKIIYLKNPFLLFYIPKNQKYLLKLLIERILSFLLLLKISIDLIRRELS